MSHVGAFPNVPATSSYRRGNRSAVKAATASRRAIAKATIAAEQAKQLAAAGRSAFVVVTARGQMYTAGFGVVAEYFRLFGFGQVAMAEKLAVTNGAIRYAMHSPFSTTEKVRTALVEFFAGSDPLAEFARQAMTEGGAT